MKKDKVYVGGTLPAVGGVPCCSECGEPATRRLTCDLDIYGVPVCDGDDCRNRAVVKLYVAVEDARRKEATP